MGKMYTLKPDESINDHMKDSMDIINHIVELSISCMRDLSNPHEGTYVDMTYNKFMRALEHIRNTIEMLDELTDELEDREDEVRREYEERVVRFFNSWMNSDMSYEYKSRAEEAVKRIHEIENHYMSEIQKLNEDLEHFRELAISRNEELEQERERSNQLGHQLKEEHDRYMKLREAKEQSPAYWKAKFERMQKKYTQLDKYCRELETEIDFLRSEDTDSVKVNNPANFCGNCEHFHIHSGDVGVCERLKDRNKLLVTDPDDASCSHFKPNNGVVIDKPEFPCCDHCNHEDCDDCTLCPF